MPSISTQLSDVGLFTDTRNLTIYSSKFENLIGL